MLWNKETLSFIWSISLSPFHIKYPKLLVSLQFVYITFLAGPLNWYYCNKKCQHLLAIIFSERSFFIINRNIFKINNQYNYGTLISQLTAFNKTLASFKWFQGLFFLNNYLLDKAYKDIDLHFLHLYLHHFVSITKSLETTGSFLMKFYK